MWFGEAGRRRIELEEDRVRRDPVWAEKMARRHASFLATTTSDASVKSKVPVGVVPEPCCSDPAPVAATSTSTARSSVLTACAVRDGDLDLASPTICSSLCPGGDTSPRSRVNVGVGPESVSATSAPISALDVSGARALESSIPSSVPAVTATHEPDLRCVKPSASTMIYLKDNTAVPASSTPTPTSLATVPVGGNLIDGGDELASTPHSISFILCHDGTTALEGSSNTDTMLRNLQVLDFAAAQLVEPDSGCSEFATVPVPQVLDDIHVTVSADPSDDTPHDDQSQVNTDAIQLTYNSDFALTLQQAAVQPPVTCDMFRTLPRNLWSPIISEVCTSIPEKMQHLVMLEQTESELYLELHILVMSNGARSQPFPWLWSLFPRDGWQCKLPWTPIQVPSSQKFYLEVDMFQKHLVFLVELKPWPSWELSILVVHCHFASMKFQWEIAWLIDLDYIAVDNKPRLPVQWDPSLWRSVELIQKWMISFSLVKLQPGPSLGKVIGGVSIFLYCGTLHEKQLCWLPWKYSSCMESLSESIPWYIAWSHVSSCAGSDSDGSGTLTSLRKYLGSWEELLTPTKDALHLQQANNTCHFLPPAGPPATCDTWVLLMAHGLLNVLICGVLLVQSYSRMVLQVITCCPRKHSFRNLVIPTAVDTMLNKYTSCYAWRLSNVTFLQASTDSCFIGYSGLRGCELVYWKIAWPLNLVYSTRGNKFSKLFHLIKVRCEGYLEKRNAALPPFSTRTVQVCLLIYWSRSYDTENCGCNYLTSGIESTVPFQFLASVAMWTFHGLEFCHRKLPWDPGIWTLLCFFGFFIRAEAKGRRNAAAPAYCHCFDHAYYFDKVCADQDYYLDVFRYQVHIGNDYYLGVFLEHVDAVSYLNLVKVCLDYSTHRDLGEVMKHQVPWDPGSSTWHRLEVKPKFKEGRMLATNPALAWAGPRAVGLGLHRSLGSEQLHIHRECLRTTRLGTGRLRPP